MENPQIQNLPTMHQDIVHDISFNYFGTRMASVSSDKQVKIWNKDSSGYFKLHSDFKSQDGPIFKVKWALPEFGNIIATCSLDKTAAVYEEKRDHSSKQGNTKNQVQWVEKYRFQEAKEQIEDIKFGPRHAQLGTQLALAVASKDGFIRIYLSENDISLKQWQNESQIKVSQLLGVNCISWNKSGVDPLMMAVGTKYNGQFTSDIIFLNEQNSIKIDTNQNIEDNNYQDESFFYIYQKTQQGWQCLFKDQEHKYVPDGINDLSWVSQNGKDYHQIAVCGKFGVKIIKYVSLGEDKINVECIDVLSGIEIWRVSWNILGTLLACSDSNNQVQVFQSSRNSTEWKSVVTLQELVDRSQQQESQKQQQQQIGFHN